MSGWRWRASVSLIRSIERISNHGRTSPTNPCSNTMDLWPTNLSRKESSSGKIDAILRYTKRSRDSMSSLQAKISMNLFLSCSTEDRCSDLPSYTPNGRQSRFLTLTSTLGGGQKLDKWANTPGEGRISIPTNFRIGQEKVATFRKSGTSLNCKESQVSAIPILRLEDLRQFVGSRTISKDGAKIHHIIQA